MTGIYAYTADSDWLHTVTFKRATTTVMTTTREPDTLSRVLSVVNSVPGQAASGSVSSYHYNARGLRDKLTLADNSYWSYGYDDRAQVTSGQRFWADNTGVGGMQHGYAFDAIGNRTGTNTNGRTATYVPTALNEYASRTVPGAIDVLGNASPSSTVTVNNQPTTRKDGYFSKALTVDNVTAAAYPSVNIVGVKSNVGPAGEDAVTNVTGHVFVPKTPEIFTFDDDGNLTGDGRWTYTWDAENRLTSMTSLASAPAESRLKLVFDYDAQGRRIRKTVLRWSTPASAYQQSAQLRFIYDRWNLIAEINVANAPVRTYIWGLDLSGGFQGAGGVGGLLGLADRQASPVKQYFPGYDGNGNVTSLVDSATGALAATYTYGSFGELLRATGATAQANPFRWSTRYTDNETGLVMYALRAYWPATGRWLSRDPIEEAGGLNLYGSVNNNPIDSYDYLGLWSKPERKNNSSWATIEASHGDTWKALAETLKLDEGEAAKWVKNYDLQPEPCKQYKIPNTVVVYTSKSVKWGSDAVFGFGNYVRHWVEGTGDALKKNGYRVVKHRQATSAELFIAAWREDGIYMYLFAGHGATSKIDGIKIHLGFMADPDGEHTVTPPEVSPLYKLSLVVGLACYSAQNQPAPTNPNITTPWPLIPTGSWRDHVSKDGTFIGYNGYGAYWNPAPSIQGPR